MKLRLAKVVLMLAALVLLCGAAPAWAADLSALPTASDALDQQAQFPFEAQTGELAVHIRAQMDAGSEAVGRLERGQTLSVLGAALNDKAEVWYEVQLEDGTLGYVRSDLLTPSDVMEAELAAYSAQNADAQKEYIGNKNTKKFHRPSCHTLPKEKNRVYFGGRDEAVSKGYAACKNCDP